MLLRFTKMHGLGNDFVMLDLISQNVRLNSEQIQKLANRHTGIGFDQLLTVEPPRNPDMDFLYRIFNADGTEAEQCGNGARCFLRFVRDRGLTTKSAITVETKNGQLHCQLERDGDVTVDMGAPRLLPGKIPFVAAEASISYELEVTRSGPCRETSLFYVSAVNMGNPHAVLVVDDVASAPVTSLGPLIGQHDRFPEGANVGFMQIVDENRVKLRVFERGVGETLACGSGACAAVVSGRLLGMLNETVEVQLTGGAVKVRWEGDNASVRMTGPVARVYEGRLHI